MRWAGNVVCSGRREMHTGLGPEGKRQLGRPRCRWEDIKMELQEIEWVGMDQVNLPWHTNQWQSSCEHGNGLSGSTKCEDFFSS
jgi:hypothetical protein